MSLFDILRSVVGDHRPSGVEDMVRDAQARRRMDAAVAPLEAIQAPSLGAPYATEMFGAPGGGLPDIVRAAAESREAFTPTGVIDRAPGMPRPSPSIPESVQPVAGPNIRIMGTSTPQGMPAMGTGQQGGFMGLMARAYNAGIPQALLDFGSNLMAASGPSSTPVNPWAAGFQGLSQSFDRINRASQEERERLERRRERLAESMLAAPSTEAPRTITMPTPQGRVPLAWNPRSRSYERVEEGQPLETTPYGPADRESVALIARMMAQDDPALAEVYAQRYAELTGRPASDVFNTM